jgi:hypothetical protein
MGFIAGFGRFWYDFIVGDDWRIAAAVVAALILVKLLLNVHIMAWPLLPLVVVLILGVSLWSVVQLE